jgi:hypothetical protein
MAITPSSIRHDERAILRKRNSAMNALIRRQPAEQPRNEDGTFAGLGLDQGARGGGVPAAGGGNAFLQTLMPERLRRENA